MKVPVRTMTQPVHGRGRTTRRLRSALNLTCTRPNWPKRAWIRRAVTMPETKYADSAEWPFETLIATSSPAAFGRREVGTPSRRAFEATSVEGPALASTEMS